MIILHKDGKPFCCGAAYLADLDDRRKADVRTKGDVLAFLHKHPDEHFLLVADGEPTHEAAPGDEAQAVLCGLVKWDTKQGALQNKALS